MKTKDFYQLKPINLISVLNLVVTALMLIGSTPAFSQETIIYAEGFENNNGNYIKIIEPADPQFPMYTGDGLWEWGTPGWISAHSGSKCWGTNFAGSMPQSTSSIVSPAISLASFNTSTHTARVSFWALTDISMTSANGRFYVSSDGSNFTKLANFYMTMAGGWNRYEFDVSSYIGGNLYLKFYMVDNGSSRGFYVDDISVSVFTKSAVSKTLTLEANESSNGSCPWIYTWNGSSYVANNDIYSTARFATGEYRDYLSLSKPLVAENGKYKLQLSEVASDESFTDYLELKVVDHAADVNVATDNSGNIFAYKTANLIPPVSAISNTGINVLDSINKDDLKGFSAYSQDYVEVNFGNIDISNGARMVLKIKGFLTGTGTARPFVGPPAIVVQSQIDGVWTEVGRMFPRFEWDVCAFDASTFSLIQGNDVKVRLFSISHDLKYTIIDFVAMETGTEPAKTVSVVPLSKALFSENSVINLLNSADNQYLHLLPGNHMNIEFDAPIQSSPARSFIFTSEGYYIPKGGTFFIATWNGSAWIIHDAYSFAVSDETKTFDLSLFLPDPDNEIKVRIWQDYAEGANYPANIDFIKFEQGSTVGTLSTATDVVNNISILSQVQASDDNRFALHNATYNRNRWSEYKWTGLTINGVPVISGLTISGSTISWVYSDPENNPQQQSSVQVWSGAGGTGTLLWGPAAFTGSSTSVSFAGDPLIYGNLYYLRVKATDGNNWSQWVEYQFTCTMPTAPGVTTNAISSITATSAKSGGTVSSHESYPVTERGVCWNTTGTPVYSDSKTSDGTGTGSFISSITGLSVGLTYYVRAYAVNSLGKSYGTERSFVAAAPVLCTPPASPNACAYMYISSVTTTGGITNFSNSSGCSATSYTNYAASYSASQAAGASVTMSFTSSGYALGYSVWIDFNNDLDLTADEKVISYSSGSLSASTSFTVPASAVLGTYKMRIRGEYQSAPSSPCTSLVYGETEDYSFTVSNPPPANPSSITVSENPICSGSSTQLTAIGAVGTVYWYTESCGGTLVTTGNPVTISPSETSIYFARNFDNSLFSTGCASINIIVNPVSVGGSISGASDITYGSSTGTLTLGSYVGSIQKWQKKLNSEDWEDIVNNSDTYSEIPGIIGVWSYRAEVKSGNCLQVNSSEFSVTVQQKELKVAGATVNSKTYDGKTNVSISGSELSGVVGTDDVILENETTGIFAQSEVGTGISVKTAMTINGTSSGNYTLTQPTITGNITLNSLTVSGATTSNKAYDGTVAATISGGTLIGVVGYDDVNLENSSSGIFATELVGTGIVVSTNMTLSGAASGNYSILQPSLVADITKKELVVSADSKSKIYGAANPDLTITYEGWAGGEDESDLTTKPSAGTTVDLLTSAGVNAGAITVAGGDDENYNFSYVAANFPVTKATLTVTADAETKVYGEVNPTLTFQSSGWLNGDNANDLTAKPSAATTVDLLTSVGVNPGAITVAGGEDENYNFSYVAANFPVTKATLTATADAKTKVYGTANPALTFQYSGWLNGDDANDLTTKPSAGTTVDLLTPVGVNPGAITVAGGVDENYDFSYVAANFPVTKATLTSTADAKIKVYGTANPALTFQYSGWFNGDDANDLTTKPSAGTTVDLLTSVGVNPGAITVAGGEDENYDFSYIAANFPVTKATLTVTADAKTKVYGEANPALTCQYSGWVNGVETIDSAPSITTTADPATIVGTYTDAITLSGGSDNNYTFSLVSGDLEVTKAVLTATADNQTKVYGEANPALSFHYSGWVNGVETIDMAPSITTPVDGTTIVGTYTDAITLSGGSDNNYTFSFVEGDLDVTKAILTATAEPKTKVYGEANPPLTFQYSGWVNGVEPIDAAPSIATTVDATTIVGTYADAITLSGGSDNNYTFSFVAGALDVTKAVLTATAEQKTKVYGEANPALTFLYSGWVYGVETIDIAPSITTAVDVKTIVGTYTDAITLSGGSDNNYTFSFVAGALNVTKAILTATAELKTKIYGSDNPALTIFWAGFRNNDEVTVINELPSITTLALKASDIGTYDITITGGDDNNYDLNLVNGSLNIDKAPLVIMANDKAKTYLEPIPELTFTWSGFVLDQNQDVIEVVPVLETVADKNSDAGTYDIIASGGVDGNYSFIYKNGIISVDKADQVITFQEIPAGLRTTQDHQLIAETTSGLSITFETSDPIIGSIDGDLLSVNKEGNLTITASQPGNQNWNPAKDVRREIVTLPTFDNLNSLFTPNNDGMNDYWYIPDLEKYGRLQVTVYNRFGQKVYGSDGYKNDWDGTWNGYPLPSASYYYIMRSSTKGFIKGVINLVR